MSAIAALLVPGAAERDVERMLDAQRARGAEHRDTRAMDGAVLGVGCHGWEVHPALAGAPSIARDGRCMAVADATLYHADDLHAALAAAGNAVRDTRPAALALAAYRAWGLDGLDRLEGDFALVLWDGAHRRLVCARDFGGKRPLHLAQLREGVAVASSVNALLARADCPRDLDPAALAAEAAGFYAGCEQTVHRAIRAVPAGGCLVVEEGRQRTVRWTRHLESDGSEALPVEAAAERLRALLESAACERVPEDGASLWLSGGWDSTAVYAAQRSADRRARRARPLHPVTLSYPPGDPGREDELVSLVLARWEGAPHWVPMQEVPLFGSATERVRERAEPFVHAFEEPNRALARASRELGAHVALDGVGGDQLFQVSPVLLADLFRTGRWRALVRHWRRLGLGRGGVRQGARDAWRWMLQPVVPPGVAALLGRLRGAPLPSGHLERPLPPWFDAAFVRRVGLVERERALAPARHATPRAQREAQREAQWYLTHPFFPRAFAAVAQAALEHGVELRSPLLDRRIVRFALSRPTAERNDGRETKRLLRRAMAGLLPDEVLAPRTRRTGVSAPWFVRAMRTTHAPWIDTAVERSWRLEELGMIHARAVRRAWERLRRDGGEGLALQFFLTLQVELWLRGRDDAACPRA